MAEEHLPERRARRQAHCPPDWVSTDSTFFITINCKERGKNQLADGTTPKGLFDAIMFYHSSHRWHVDLALVMPDHIHTLVSFKWDPGNGMMSLIRNWKRYTASHLGIVWQRDYFDHRIRSEADMQSTWYYIRENPVRAGLVESFDLWPHVWRPENRIGWEMAGTVFRTVRREE